MAKTKTTTLEPMTFRIGPECYPHTFREGTGLLKVGDEFDWPERAPVTDQPSLKFEPLTQRAYDKQVKFHGAQAVFAAWPESEFGPGADDPEIIEADEAARKAADAAELAAQQAHEAASIAAVARRNRRIEAGVQAAEADARLETDKRTTDDQLEQTKAELEENKKTLENAEPKTSRRRARSGRASDTM